MRSAGATALGTALSALPGAAFGQENATQALLDQAFKAQGQGDFAAAASLFRQVYETGRTDEFVLRGLAWNLSRLWKHPEAIRLSLENNRRNPCAWSVAQICDAYISAGDYDEGRKWLQYASKNEGQWGNVRPVFESAIEQIAVKTYVLEYTLDPNVLARVPFLRHQDFLCPVPIPDLPYQKSQYEVVGAQSFKEEIRAQNRCLRVTPEGSKPAIVRSTVTITPTNYRSKVRDFTANALPKEAQALLKSTRNVEIENSLVQAIVVKQKGKTSTETIDNICQWDHFHLKYEGSGKQGGGTVAVLQRMTGHCEGLTSGVVGVLRAAGIPARFVRGYGAIVGKSGVPTMHSWTEFYIPSVGWIQWDGENAPFTVPAKICIGTFRYTSPYDAPGAGDPETLDLWNFEAVLFPEGSVVGQSGNVHFKRIKQEL